MRFDTLGPRGPRHSLRTVNGVVRAVCSGNVPAGRLDQGKAGEQAADEARADRRAGRFEPLCLFRVHQEFGDQVTPTGLRRIAQREWKFGKATIVVLGKVDRGAGLDGSVYSPAGPRG